ncbi:UNC-like C-terminal-domain-containing protein [Collybia nuda]|uniref:UNC-like C-terminal-domain-containing protein n=1 Tax=Collybia nuda TaxID=64659 RepID=A0A9P6CJD2_9AGAR|nr:UNC-like C-terminal-domain-containing protein [Collybia nuda]
MLSLQVLPAALVALLWALPAFAVTSSSANDPFRAIATQVVRPPKLPVCCLKPLMSPEPVGDEVFLSFEEWKAKQFVIQEQAKAKERSDVLNRYLNGSKGSGDSREVASPSSVDSPIEGEPLYTDETAKSQLTEPLSPHFRVPLTDRFNYASLDCSARIHASHRSAKSASSILSSKRDRYMLSPCNPRSGEKKFIVVELCEDIRIDTVQLANFEFFSGVFKEFSISVIKTYTGKDDDEWTLAGTYKAKNVRGVQSFHPPTSLRDFYRYIRIDFVSHYSNEFYCPVSLLRVYGLTHLEQWKWDMWEEQSRAKRDEKDKAVDPQFPPPTVQIVMDGTMSLNASPNIVETGVTTDASENATTMDIASKPPTQLSDSITMLTPSLSVTMAGNTKPGALVVSGSIGPATRSSKSTTPSAASTTNAINESSTTIQNSSSLPLHPISKSTPTALSSTKTLSTQRNQVSKPSLENSAMPNTVSSLPRTTTSITVPFSSSAMISSSVHTTPSNVASAPVISPPAITIGGGGESIYRTIMNRLTALEANHTLYTRYLEQQTSGVRDVLKRLGEDIGRLEGIGRAQAVTFQRAVNEWEARQRKLQMDYGELMLRIEYLSDEIVLEKRLGIAQLCLLLAVLVFMGLTRGSRGEPLMMHGQKSMREWGKRHLSFSGDWTTRFGRGRNRTRSPPKPHPDVKPLPEIINEGVKIAFPSKEIWNREPLEMSDRNNLPTTSDLHTRLDSRSRTPSVRNRHHHRPVTPTLSAFRPRQLQRSNSQGGGTQHSPGSGGTITVPTSARKWAKTPHLHEVRKGDGRYPRKRDYGRSERENEIDDIFSVPATAPAIVSRYGRREDSPNLSLLDSEIKDKAPKLLVEQAKSDDGEGDPWVDTEESEAEWDTKMELGRTITFSGNEH